MSPRKSRLIKSKLIGLLVITLLSLPALIQLPAIQTRVVQLLTQKVEELIGAKVSIGSVHIRLTGSLAIRDIVLTDNEPYSDDRHNWEIADTVLHVRLLTGTFGYKGILKHEGIHLGRIHIHDTDFHLVSEPTKYRCNINRIIGVVPEEAPPPKETNPVFDIRRIRLDNVRFKMHNYMPMKETVDRRSPYGIHFEDMDATVEKMRVHGLKFAYGRMSGYLDKSIISEKRGYRVDDISGKFAAGSGLTSVQGLHFKDKWSEVCFSNVTMDYSKGEKAFLRFITDVRLAISADDAGVLDIRTISGVCGALYGNESAYRINKIRAEGSVADINVKALDFNELKTGLNGSLSCTVKGLPDVQKMVLGGVIRDVKFTPEKAHEFVRFWASNYNLAFGGDLPFTLNGTVNGPLRHLDVDVRLDSEEAGLFAGNVLLYNIAVPEDIPLALDASVHTAAFDAGRMFGIKDMGRVTMDTSGWLEIAHDSPNFRLDSLIVGKLGFLGYDYSGIQARAFKDGEKILAHIESSDPNLGLNMLADCNGKPGQEDFNLKLAADLNRADLHALSIDNRGEVSSASAKINALFYGTEKKETFGSMNVKDILLVNDYGRHDIGDMNVGVILNDSLKLSLSSEFAEASFKASSKIGNLVAELKESCLSRELPAVFKPQESTGCTGSYSAEVEFLNSYDLLQFVKPGVYLHDSTKVKFQLDSGVMKASVTSRRIASGANYLKDFTLTADNSQGKLSAVLDGREMRAAGFMFENAALKVEADSNEFDMGIKYDVSDSKKGKGRVHISGEFYRDATDTLVVRAKPERSDFQIGDELWTLEGKEFMFRKGNILLDKFCLHSGQQRIELDGGMRRDKPDTMTLVISNLGMAVMNHLKTGMAELRGHTNGRAVIISPLGEQFRIGGKIVCDSLAVGKTEAGDLTIAGKWNDLKKAVDIYVENRKDGHDMLNSYISIDTKTKSMDASAELDKMCPAVALPFLSNIFSGMDGTISGKISAKGPFDALDISSRNLRVDDLALALSATGVNYIFNGPIELNGKEISLKGITISDKGTGRGALDGTLSLDKKRQNLSASLDFNNLQVIDLKETSGKTLYGDLKASGKANISGPLSNLDIRAIATTAGNGNVHVPLGSSQESAVSDLLTYVKKNKVLDRYEMMMMEGKTAEKAEKSNIAIRASITATPSVKAYIEIDKATENILTATGGGTVNLFIQPNKDIFTLDGKYNIEGGYYHFQTAGILSKEFTIQNGSSLSFNGGVMESTMDVTALYNLKTSLNTLIADTTSVSTRRLVQCGIHLSESIKNLNVGFSIDVPDLDPTTKTKVESALNTEDKVQKQFVSLLLFGTFLPSEQSGVVNSTNMLYSNLSEIMSGQINSILQKLDIPVDLGLGYQQDKGGTDIFDVAVSTQLFNNRVLVNGSVGNRRNKTSSSQYGDVVGDLDIAIKLDKAGIYRATLFSHSADEFSNYLDHSQRNGVGVSVQKEFHNFQDLFRSRKKEAELPHDSVNDSMTVFRIKPKDYKSPRSSSSR